MFRDRGGDHEDLFDAIVQDLAGWRARTGPRRAVALYLGGGTPSRLTTAQVTRLITTVDALWGLEAGAEITLEANPEDADAALFRGFRDSGVTRVSLGVQSLDDAALKRLGRWHSGAEARSAIATAQQVFDAVNVDLIYAREDQTLADWEAELGAVLAMGVDHLSPYQLTIEPGTAFSKRHDRGELALPDDDDAADFFALTHALTEAAGLPAYEVSNHARPGAESRHNAVYWRSGDWVGAGPGAHGRMGPLGGERLDVAQHRGLVDYIGAVTASGWGAGTVELLSVPEQAREMVAMGLRLRAGFDLTPLIELGAAPGAEALDDAEALGLIVRDGARVTVADEARALTDGIAARLAAAIPDPVDART